ncbi:MAG TPA: hypothetical protein ENN60_01205 [archaeon]|nr:hypothetical protein [archaeon]
MKVPWVVLAVGSLVAISLFSIYVTGHLAQGILCSYVYLTPYFLPVAYILGFLFGYAIPQITQKERDPKQLAGLFEGDEREAVMVALEGKTQADLSSKIGKVRAHRTIRKLETTGLVQKERVGRSYRLVPGARLKKVL